MAVAISPEESSYFSSALRRSYSNPKFSPKHSAFRASSSTSRISDTYHQPIKVFSDSTPSSAPPSPRAITADAADLSASPKSAPDLSLNPTLERLQLATAQVEEPFALPCYDDVGFFNPPEDLEPPPSPGGLGESYNVSPSDNTSTGTSRPDTPDLCF